MRRIALSLAAVAALSVSLLAAPAANADPIVVPLPAGKCVVVDTSEAYTVYECSGIPYISLPNHI